MLHNQKEAVRRQTTKRQVGHGAIINRIGAALEKETRVNLHRHPIKLEFTGMQVRSKNGVVTLNGLVPSETMQRIAVRDTWFIFGVRDVVNKIQAKW